MIINIQEILNEICKTLDEKNCDKILLQFPDGLKPFSKEIYDALSKKFPNKSFFIWFGSNFGGCDIPIWLKTYGFDCIIHFGHSRFIRSFKL